MKDEWMYEQDEGYDRILGQTTGLLTERGDERAVALLVDMRSMTLADTGEVIRTEKVFDPWTVTEDDQPATRTIYRRAALLGVGEHLVPRFTDEVCQRFPRPTVTGHTTLTARLASERPSKPSRLESGRASHHIEDGLTFGSAEELRICRGNDTSFETVLGAISVRQPRTRRSHKINMSREVRPYRPAGGM